MIKSDPATWVRIPKRCRYVKVAVIAVHGQEAAATLVFMENRKKLC